MAAEPPDLARSAKRNITAEMLPRHRWGVAGAGAVVGAVAGTIALNLLTRGVVSWVLALVVAILWVAGLDMLVSVARNRPGLVPYLPMWVIRLGLSAIGLVSWLIMLVVGAIVLAVIGLFGMQASAGVPEFPREWVQQITDAVAERMKRERGPLWKRAAVTIGLLLAERFDFMGYWLLSASAASLSHHSR